MNMKMTRFAVPGKWADFGARGLVNALFDFAFGAGLEDAFEAALLEAGLASAYCVVRPASAR
jgi:hypothetical protein